MFNGLTNIGKEYIAKCLAENKPITFTKVKIGDGLLDLDENAELLTDVKSLKKEVEILDKTQEGELTTLTILLDNSDIEVGYYPREIGIYVTDDGIEKLYWYINDGLETQWLCAANKYPIKFKQIINLMTTNLESVIVNWSGKDLFVDREFVEEKIKEKVRTFEIPTIAELQSRKNLKVGDIVEVLGYYTAGDGAGHKRIIANKDDGSGVQLKNGLWTNIVHNGEVNVSWFGAKGNGIIDNLVQIQKAIKFAENHHTTLFVPSGIYNISDTLIISKSISIKGCSHHYDMLSSDNIYKGLSIFKLVNVNSDKTLITTQATAYDVTISYLIFSSDTYKVETTGEIATKGNPKKYYKYTSSAYKTTGLNLENSTRVSINNCTFNGFSREGIVTGQHRHITDCVFTNCNIGINISNYDNIIHHCWFRFCSVGIYSLNSNTVFLSDSWFDQIEQFGIKNNGGGFMLISNCEFDLIDYCAIYTKYLWNTFIQARQSRCGLYYGGFEPNEVPEGEEYKACCIFSESTSKDCNLNIHVQRREIKPSFGVAPSFFYHGKGLNNSNVILDIDVDHVAKNWVFDNTNLIIAGKQYKARYTLKYNNIGCTSKDNLDPNNFYYSIDQGDMYISTKGKIYISTKANSNADWVFIGEKSDVLSNKLGTSYMETKMKQENVYDDYIAYMDEKTVYDKQQRNLEQEKQLVYQEALKENPDLSYEEFMSVQPMTLNLIEEPQPSLALQEFMKKYL